MMYQTIQCPCKDRRALIESVVSFAVRALIPRIRNLDLEIEVTDLDENDSHARGYCTQESERHFLLEICENQTDDSIIRTIIHEMVHVKQYVYRELIQKYGKDHGHRVYWRGEDWTNTIYTKQPWELEAYELEDTLYNEYCNNRS
jgi:hypothetical protein